MAAAPAYGEQDNYATPRQEFPYDSTENLFRKWDEERSEKWRTYYTAVINEMKYQLSDTTKFKDMIQILEGYHEKRHKELDTKLDDIKKKMQDLDSKLEDLKVMRPINKIEEYISKVIPWIWVFGVGCGFILLFRELMTPSVCVMPADLLDKSCIFLRR